jgi:hypothetical protein
MAIACRLLSSAVVSTSHQRVTIGAAAAATALSTTSVRLVDDGPVPVIAAYRYAATS